MQLNKKISLDASFPVLFSLSLLIVPLRWVIAWVAAVTFHELGLYGVLKLFGGNVLSFQIRGYGCRMEATPLLRWQEALCICAGPVMGLVLTLFSEFVPRTAICAFVQTIFNLLPIYPLDGGRLLSLFRNKKEKHLAKCLPQEYNG